MSVVLSVGCNAQCNPAHMQSTSQTCGRIAWLLRHTAASFVETSTLTTAARTSVTESATSSCSYSTVCFDTVSASRVSPFPGRYISSFTACSQNEISTEDRKVWSDLTQHQKKQMLKPDKNRNHFKRMWKKDLQIRQAHQARKRQQAIADATRLKLLRDKWQGSAALWQGYED